MIVFHGLSKQIDTWINKAWMEEEVMLQFPLAIRKHGTRHKEIEEEQSGEISILIPCIGLWLFISYFSFLSFFV